MAPTLQAGDRILVLRSSFLTGSIGRGDIIVFHRPAHLPCQTSGSGQYLVQRVIGLPGETIWSDHQTIYVDGKRIAERGWYDPAHGAVSSVQVSEDDHPKGDYFVLADNRSDSCDSRSFGAIPGTSALGKVVAVIARQREPASARLLRMRLPSRAVTSAALVIVLAASAEARARRRDLRRGRRAERHHTAASRPFGRRQSLGLVGGLPARAPHEVRTAKERDRCWAEPS